MGIMTSNYYKSEEIFITLASQFYKDPRGFLYFKIENEKNCTNFNAEQLNKYIYVAANIIEETPTPLLLDLRNTTRVHSSNTFSLLAKVSNLNANFTKISFLVNSLSPYKFCSNKDPPKNIVYFEKTLKKTKKS